jgi:hypothetical protein
MTKKTIIGRIDRVDFPMLGLRKVDVKIDTGAYTSSIHCSHIEETDGILRCSFDSAEHKNFQGHQFEFSNYSFTDVKSSNGCAENRYKIRTEVLFFGKSYPIDLTLSTRADMKYPVLIGRQFLTRRFLVDVDLTYVSFKNQMHEYCHPVQES